MEHSCVFSCMLSLRIAMQAKISFLSVSSLMLGISCTKEKWCERSRVHAGWENCSRLLDFHFDAQHATNKQAFSSAFWLSSYSVIVHLPMDHLQSWYELPLDFSTLKTNIYLTINSLCYHFASDLFCFWVYPQFCKNFAFPWIQFEHNRIIDCLM